MKGEDSKDGEVEGVVLKGRPSMLAILLLELVLLRGGGARKDGEVAFEPRRDMVADDEELEELLLPVDR